MNIKSGHASNLWKLTQARKGLKACEDALGDLSRIVYWSERVEFLEGRPPYAHESSAELFQEWRKKRQPDNKRQR